MDDYIKRHVAINVIANAIIQGESLGMGIAEDILYDVPSEDVQPVRHGHWIIKDNPGTGWYRVTCSECGEDVTSVAPVIGFFPNARVTWDFCYNCGAKMDGEQND